LRPATNQFGSTTITLTARDGDGGAASASFLLSVNSVNRSEERRVGKEQCTDEDTPTAAIPFSIGDVETPAGDLIVSGRSSNPELVIGANLLIGGRTSTRTVTLRPATNQFGSTTITLTVRDGDGGAASASFLLSVNSVNHPPTISSVANQSTEEHKSTRPNSSHYLNSDTAPDNLMVSGRSSNPDLLPYANILFAGSGSNPLSLHDALPI